MPDKISLSWSLLTPHGIAIDENNEIWNSGCVRALLPINPSGVLIATDSGGIWYADSTGIGYSLADLDSPNLICLAKTRYFAGGVNLWASESTSTIPQNIWSPVLPTTTNTGLPIGQ